MVYPGYFETLGIPLLAGRDLGEADLEPSSPLVAVVNEALARQLFRGMSPVGRSFMTSRGRSGFQRCEIVGLVKDSRYANLRGETPAVVYQPFLQTNTGRGQMVLHVRSRAARDGPLLEAVRQELRRLDKDLPSFEVQTLAAAMDAALVRERLVAALASCFGLLALLLACVGLYGLMAYGVVQRTGELGLRFALGARRGEVLWMVLREGLGLVLIGVAIGAPLALALARLASSRISGLLYGLDATDAPTVATAVFSMLAAAGLAGYLPARAAARVDPIVALRNE